MRLSPLRPEPAGRGAPTRSLRQRFLRPFAGGVGLLSIAVGVVTALGTRDAAETELVNRAHTAHRIFVTAMEQQQAQLASQATARTRDPNFAGALERYSSRDLAGVRFTSTLTNRFDYVALVGVRGSHVYSSRGADWRTFGPDSAVVGRARRGISEQGTGVTHDGEPVVFASLAVPITAPVYGVVLVGQPVKTADLQRIARPLDLALAIVTARGKRVSSRGDEAPPPSSRTFRYPLQVPGMDGRASRLEVSVSTAPLTRATNAAAAEAAAVALGLALTLLGLVAVLLNRAVLYPLASLRAAIGQVQGGAYQVSLRFRSSRELGELADGFNRMAAMVGEQQAHLAAQATTDSLTGLANHAGFHSALGDAVEHARQTGRPLAVVALDVDHFKEINDRHGHPEGDRVLRAIGERLCETLDHPSAVAGRVGGDEFALLLPDADAEAAVALAERLRASVGEASIAGQRISTSVGVACFPGDTDDPAALLEGADQALYAVKRGGRGRARRYTPGADQDPAARIEPLLRPEGIVPVFQPIVSLATGEIAGYEALSRFPGADQSPDAWFDEAYRCNLGPRLEAAAIQAALRTAGRPAGTYLALNLTPSGVSSPEVASVLPDDLSDIVIEVTEHEFVADREAFLAGLERLRRRGARIALDDAGAGYAGLQQVISVRPEIIKLDRSLVANADEQRDQLAVIHALVTLAASTQAEICAEGIETIDELLTVARVGAHLGQGYLLARPDAPWSAVAEAPITALRGTGLSPPEPAGEPAWMRDVPWVAS